MSESELYKNEERSIMIQECNALQVRIIGFCSYQNPAIWRGDQVLISLN